MEGGGEGGRGGGRGRVRLSSLQRLLGAVVVCNGVGDDCLLVGCLTCQQHASVSQGRVCSDNFTCCHTERREEFPSLPRFSSKTSQSNGQRQRNRDRERGGREREGRRERERGRGNERGGGESGRVGRRERVREREREREREILFVGCLTSQQHASVSQGRICSDNFTCCHKELAVANQTFHLTQSQYTDSGPTSSQG